MCRTKTCLFHRLLGQGAGNTASALIATASMAFPLLPGMPPMADTPTPPTSDGWEQTPQHLDDYDDLYGTEAPADLKPLSASPAGSGFRAATAARSINYISVMVEWPDADMQDIHLDDDYTRKAADMIAADGGRVITPEGEYDITTVKEYFRKYSYGKLDVNMKFFPQQGGKTVSYVSRKPRSYYLKKSATNPDGVTPDTKVQRELELINEITAAVAPQLEAAYSAADLDTNNDGYVDALSFFIEGPFLDRSVTRGDVLWSHKASLALNTQIHGKQIAAYNVNNAGDSASPGGIFSHTHTPSRPGTTLENLKLNRATYSVLIHEFLHTLGLFDLYRAGGQGDPVGFYDIMAYNLPSTPQAMLAVHTRTALRWGNQIPLVRGNETVRLNKPAYADPREKVAYRIDSPLSTNEYFIVEYYRQVAPGLRNQGRSDGYIIYRVSTAEGLINLEGSPADPSKDGVFIFRPGENSNGEANRASLAQAVQPATVGTTYGKTLETTGGAWDKDSLYFSDGRNSGITLEVVGSGTDFIDLKITAPETHGSGTAADPYLISTATEWANLVRDGKHVKVVADIDFTGVAVTPAALREAVIDGDGHTLKNLTITGNGLFESLDRTTISNLTLDHITVNGVSEHAGTLAAAVYEGTRISGVHVLSGQVNAGSASPYGFQGVGGLVGTITGGSIDRSSTAATVNGGKNTGGFIGLAQGGTITNNVASGAVTSTGKKGSFYGSALSFGSMTNDATYTDNVYVIREAGQPRASQAGDKAGIYGVALPDSAAIDMTAMPTLTITPRTEGVNVPAVTVTSVTSDQPSIADGHEWTVTGHTAGNATLTYALTLGGASWSATLPVTVTAPTPPTIPLTGISLTPTRLALTVGENGTLNVTYTPNDTTDPKDVVWTSSHEDVATVTDGVVTAHAPGRATITATVGSHTAMTQVEVRLPATDLRVDKTRVELEVPNTSMPVASLLPENTTDTASYTWESANPSVATVDSTGVITAVAQGTTTVTVTAHLSEKPLPAGRSMWAGYASYAQGAERTLSATVDVIVTEPAPTPVPVDKSALTEALRLLDGSIDQATTTDGMTEDSVRAYEDALARARAAAAAGRALEADEAATRDAVNTQAAAVQEARDALVQARQGLTPKPVNRTALQDAVRDLDASVNQQTSTEGMTEESVRAYEDALARARTALNDARTVDGNESATQDEVNAQAAAARDALNALEDARRGLTVKPTPSPTPSPSGEPTVAPSVTPAPTPTTTPTPAPQPTSQPTATSTPAPQPTTVPPVVPQPTATVTPAPQPSVTTTPEGTAQPTVNPTSQPTSQPSGEPSAQPRANPGDTTSPSVRPGSSQTPDASASTQSNGENTTTASSDSSVQANGEGGTSAQGSRDGHRSPLAWTGAVFLPLIALVALLSAAGLLLLILKRRRSYAENDETGE